MLLHAYVIAVAGSLYAWYYFAVLITVAMVTKANRLVTKAIEQGYLVVQQGKLLVFGLINRINNVRDHQ